ncbi:MAG: SGNH/GDSL hydrolase family protein [Spirochaetes bacterium]|nr:SGNH/GDSL hydrolase family protein [Spirochaetota bacterium]
MAGPLARFARRIREKTENNAAPPVLIAALGDSVTQGCFANGVMDFEAVYHHQWWKRLARRYPRCTFSVLNLGVGGQSAPAGLARFADQLLPHHPDLTLLGFALNDAGAGLRGLEAYRKTMDELMGRILGEAGSDLIVLTPNFIASRDNPRVHPDHRQLGYVEKLVPLQTGGVLARYAGVLRELAAARGAAVADVYALWESWEKGGMDPTDRLENGLNHPDREAHRAVADLLDSMMAELVP